MAKCVDFQSGPLEARISEDTGAVALAGPDRAGAPHATVITFEPPSRHDRRLDAARSAVSSPRRRCANGFELVQDVGGTNVTARLTFPADGVMRYEVTDWNGLKPDKTSIAAASDGNEHFYGFGEKFNALDQAGNVVDIADVRQPRQQGGPFVQGRALVHQQSRATGSTSTRPRVSTFDMRTAAGRYSVTNHFGTLAYHVVYGPALTDVLSRYTGLTGRPALPPPFAFGPVDLVRHLARRRRGQVRRHQVPRARHPRLRVRLRLALGDRLQRLQVQHPGRRSSTRPTRKTPSSATPAHSRGSRLHGIRRLTDMMTFFRKNGLKVICWMTPFVNSHHSNDEGSARPEHGRGQAGREGRPSSSSAHPRTAPPWWCPGGRARAARSTSPTRPLAPGSPTG